MKIRTQIVLLTQDISNVVRALVRQKGSSAEWKEKRGGGEARLVQCFIVLNSKIINKNYE